MPGGMTWGRWLVGKALPLAICAALLIGVGQGLLADAARLGREGLGLYPTLDLVRRALTLVFVLLIAASYLTRSRVVSSAQGFSERVYPMLVLLAGPVGVVFLGGHAVPERLGLAAAGLLAALAGGGLSLWSLWHLRGSFSILAEARTPVTTGPYRFVRHPLYLGEAMMMLGLCLMIGTPLALLFWASLNGLQIIRARIEERKLASQFDEYRRYQQRTRFIVPGVY